MRLLDRYLLIRFVSALTLSVVGLLLIAIVVDLTENIDTFIDHHAAVAQILLYYLYHTPYWIILTLPIAALMGTLFSLTGLARRNEITAMKAAGISLYRVLAPLLVFAAVFSGVAFLFADRVLPTATFRYNTIRDEIRSYSRSDGSRRQVLLQDVDGQYIFTRSYDARRRKAHEILWERQWDSRIAERVVANRLEWRDGEWMVFEGRHYGFGPEEEIATSAFDSLKLERLTLKPSDFERQQKKPEEMNFAELQNYISRARANGEDVTRQLVDLHLKISFPVTCFIVVLLGAPLGANTRRAGWANSFGVGILICFAFYSCVKMGQALGWNQILPPLVGSWLANIVFGLFSAVLLWRAHK